MPEDENDTLADSPKDTVGGTVKKRPGPRAPVKPDSDALPAGQRNRAYRGEQSEGADHDTEEAAAYRENDA